MNTGVLNVKFKISMSIQFYLRNVPNVFSRQTLSFEEK